MTGKKGKRKKIKWRISVNTFRKLFRSAKYSKLNRDDANATQVHVADDSVVINTELNESSENSSEETSTVFNVEALVSSPLNGGQQNDIEIQREKFNDTWSQTSDPEENKDENEGPSHDDTIRKTAQGVSQDDTIRKSPEGASQECLNKKGKYIQLVEDDVEITQSNEKVSKKKKMKKKAKKAAKRARSIAKGVWKPVKCYILTLQPVFALPTPYDFTKSYTYASYMR